jgi:hypothetical protein
MATVRNRTCTNTAHLQFPLSLDISNISQSIFTPTPALFLILFLDRPQYLQLVIQFPIFLIFHRLLRRRWSLRKIQFRASFGGPVLAIRAVPCRDSS